MKIVVNGPGKNDFVESANDVVCWRSKCNGNGKKETLGRPELDASPLPAKRPWGGTKRKCRNIKPVLWALHLEAVPLPWPLHLAKSRL